MQSEDGGGHVLPPLGFHEKFARIFGWRLEDVDNRCERYHTGESPCQGGEVHRGSETVWLSAHIHI